MKKTIILILSIFSYLSFSQENEKIKNISTEACECIKEIDVNKTKEEKTEAIKTCIRVASMSAQLSGDLLDSVKKKIDSIENDKAQVKDTITVDSGKRIEVNVDENYEEIEEYLYDNCPALKHIYFVDNTEHDNSYSNRKKAMKFYEKGQQAFSREDYYEAVIQFSKAVKKDKNFAFAWDNLGYSYRKLKNYKQAIASYKKSLALDPRGKMPLMNIAVAYQLDNNLDSAIEAYENYKTFYPKDPEGFYGLGRIQYFQKSFEPALENMIKAYFLYIEMDSPYNIDAQKHIGFIYQEMRSLGQLEAFKRITKENNLEVNIED